MRKVIKEQGNLFCPAIDEIKFDLHSRDEIPQFLMGLQAIHKDKKRRKEIFEILKELTPKGVDPGKGRKGMDLWKIFILGMLRTNCNIDFDKLHELANEHKTLRMMIGHGKYDNRRYPLQTIKDNVALFTSEIIDKINKVAVEFGHGIVGKKPGEPLNGSCDSFVLETDVHFPTDIRLLFDAMRKTIECVGKLCDNLGLAGWREKKNNIKKIKRKFRKASMLKRSTSKKEDKKAQRIQLIKDAHQDYINLSQKFLDKAQETIKLIDVSDDIILQAKTFEIQKYINHGTRQTDHIRRRVINDESIPHHEKVFSIFEEHTEWISKGKAGVPVELGKRVCIVKDQYGFILHHQVMENETDDKVAVPIILETKKRFPDFKSCSFDKGFHSPYNQKRLDEILESVYLPRKGRLSKAAKEIEHSDEFRQARRKHSAVESSINALENHGLDRCRDHGLHGLKRYVALAVVARNIQIIGRIIQQKELKKKRRLKNKLLKELPLAA